MGDCMKHIIFDLDGTLLDSAHAWEKIGIEYLKLKQIVPHHSAEALDYELEVRNLEEGAAFFQTEYGVSDSTDQILRDISSLVAQRYDNYLLKDCDNAKKVLRTLSEAFTLHVLTSNFAQNAMKALRNNGVLSLFAHVEMIAMGTSKSDGSAYMEFLKRHHIAKDDVIVVEDALHAVKGLKQQGICVIAMEELFFPYNIGTKTIADAYVKDYTQLYDAVWKLKGNLS